MGRQSKKNNRIKNTKQTKKKKSTVENSSATTQQQQQADDGGWLYVDPERIRYQHSRIRPYFSGCGRSVEETLQSIRDGTLDPSQLPPIQVIVGVDNWYFTLNNRRLWVLKQCRTEGLLVNNVIRVRVKEPKSRHEKESRYTIENCSLHATFIREAKKTLKNHINDDDKSETNHSRRETIKTVNVGKELQVVEDNKEILTHTKVKNTTNRSNDDDDDDDGTSSDEEDRYYKKKNPFCLYEDDDSSSSSSSNS